MDNAQPTRTLDFLILLGAIIISVFLCLVSIDIIKRMSMDEKVIYSKVVPIYQGVSFYKDKPVYRMRYDFSVEGKDYSCLSNYETTNADNSSSFFVYYKRNNPSDCIPPKHVEQSNARLSCFIAGLVLILLSKQTRDYLFNLF